MKKWDKFTRSLFVICICYFVSLIILIISATENSFTLYIIGSLSLFVTQIGHLVTLISRHINN